MVGNAIFLIAMVAETISCFEIANFWALDTLILLKYAKTRMFQIELCRNASIQMDVLKNRSLTIEDPINYIPRIEKIKQVPVCEMLEPFRSLSSSMLSILS